MTLNSRGKIYFSTYIHTYIHTVHLETNISYKNETCILDFFEMLRMTAMCFSELHIHPYVLRRKLTVSLYMYIYQCRHTDSKEKKHKAVILWMYGETFSRAPTRLLLSGAAKFVSIELFLIAYIPNLFWNWGWITLNTSSRIQWPAELTKITDWIKLFAHIQVLN